jgi:hypothetical protein
MRGPWTCEFLLPLGMWNRPVEGFDLALHTVVLRPWRESLQRRPCVSMVRTYQCSPQEPLFRFFFLPPCVTWIFSEPSRPSCVPPKDRWRLLVFVRSLSRPFHPCPSATCPVFLDASRFAHSCPQPCHIFFLILFSLPFHTLLKVRSEIAEKVTRSRYLLWPLSSRL